MMPLLIGTQCITESGENANPISDDQVAGLLPTLPKRCTVCSESSEKTNPIFDDHVASFNSSKTLHSLLTWKANPRNKLLVHVLDQTRSNKTHKCACMRMCKNTHVNVRTCTHLLWHPYL
jgi:hypothetical protein